MSEARRNLWPDAVDVTAITPPVVFLREQAALLGERTKGLVHGEIESRTEPLEKVEEFLDQAISGDDLVTHVHTMYLVAPALDNYQYVLLSVRHDFGAYPCRVLFHPATPTETFEQRGTEWFTNPEYIGDEEVFIEWLGVALQRMETTRVIQALIYRIQKPGDT